MKDVKISQVVAKTFIYAVLIFASIVTLVPVLYSIFGSFKNNMELMTSISLLPKKWTVANYVKAWNGVNFAKYTCNSLFIATFVVIGSVISATMSGYVLSRKDFPGKRVIKSVYIWSMFIALGPAIIFPVFDVIVKSGLNQNLTGLILVQIGAQVANIILVEGYLSGISMEFDEAAKIDGCGFFRTYWNIIFPLMKPIVAVIVLFAFRGSWNDYLMSMIITMGQPDLTPLTVAVVSMKSTGNMATDWTIMLAGTTISIVPIIIVYIFTNKYFVAGITLGGVKG